MEEPNSRSVVIRDAEPSELDEVGRVVLSAYEEYAAVLPKEAWADYSADILDMQSRLEESELLVASQDRRIVGAVTFYPTYKRRESLVWPSDWTGIRLVAVGPESRKQGIGRMLVEECISRSRAQGAAAVGLHTTPMMTVAAAMYERIGFVRVPEFDSHHGAEWTVAAYKFLLS